MPTAACRAVERADGHQRAAFAELLPRVLGDDEGAVEADVDDGAELVDRQVGDQPEAAEARAVDDDVERPDLVEEPLHRCLVGDVDLGGGVRIAEFAGSGACTVDVAVRESHSAAVGGQGARARPARFRTPRR